jgi:uncharacterized protein YbjT (DUF2867 family)
MATVAVVGANGKTGRLVVERLKRRGDRVIPISRNGSPLRAKFRAPAVDCTRATVDQLAQAFRGSDAVVFAAGGNPRMVDRDASIKVVEAAELAGVKRFVHVSAIGADGELPPDVRGSDWEEFYDAKRAADRVLRSSSLDWTILEPNDLADGRATGRVEMAEYGVTYKPIPRADVAAVIVAALDDPRTVGHSWELISGDTEIAAAIDSLV